MAGWRSLCSCEDWKITQRGRKEQCIAGGEGGSGGGVNHRKHSIYGAALTTLDDSARSDSCPSLIRIIWIGAREMYSNIMTLHWVADKPRGQGKNIIQSDIFCDNPPHQG